MFKAYTSLALCVGLLGTGTHALASDGPQDPTRPWASEARSLAKAPAFTVSAILISDQRRVAVLNGRAVTAGDRVDGATVSAIGPRTVRLRYRGRDIEAALPKGKIRQ
ncbi:MAG: hypothetical protein AAFN78_14080 [Pseudomonadota bacterium]